MPSRKLSILLIEDIAGDAETVRACLNSRPDNPVELTIAASLSEALPVLRDRSADLILLNDTLPDCVGEAVFTTALCHADGVPVVVLADEASDAMAVKAIRRGIQDYLVKDGLSDGSFLRSLRLAIERQRLARSMDERLHELEASRARYENLVRENADAMVVTDADGRFLFANPAAEAFFGQGVGDLLDTSQFIPLQSGADGKFQIERPDGASASGQMRIAPGHWGDSSAWIVTIRDSTATDTLVEALETAEHAKRIKSRFLAGVSHELRTPLNSILGYAEAMKMELFGALENERYADYVGNIFQSGHQLLALIDDLLDLSSAEKGGIELKDSAIDLVMIIKTAIAATAEAADKKAVSVNLHSEWQNIFVRADGLRLLQVFLGVLSNAVKFNEQGGCVTVNLSNLGIRGISVSVADTGIGIGESELPTIFEPFSRHGHERAHTVPGAAVGLSVTRRLVERHDATITIESILNEGTVVDIVFPAARILAGEPEMPVRIRA